MAFLYLFLKLKKNKSLVIVFLLTLYFVVFITGERLSFFILNVYYFIFSILLIRGKLKKIYFILSFILIFIGSLNYSKNFNPRSSLKTIFSSFTSFNYTYCEYTKDNIRKSEYLSNKWKKIPNCNSLLEFKDIKIYYFYSVMHHNHYLSAYEMFKNNFWFGIGPKNFRLICNQEEYFLNEFSCSTHPHNYILQILAETGIFGGVIFILIYLGFFFLFLKEFF